MAYAKSLRNTLSILSTLSVLAGLGVACGGGQLGEEKTFDGQVRRVEVEMDGGTLHIQGEQPRRSPVSAAVHWTRDPQARVSATLQDGILRVSATCPIRVADCQTHLFLVAPNDAAVVTAAGTGELKIERILGPVNATIDRGRIELFQLGGEIDVATVDGEVVGSELSTPVAWAESINGNVQLQFASPPQEVSATTTEGDVEVGLPEGVFNIYADTMQGDLHLDVERSIDSERRIFARTRVGDVSILQ